MQYWWVNQNQTYSAEVLGDFIWSPKVRSNGTRNPYYDSMTRVKPGDIVFSFCDTRIKAVGIARGTARTSPKPGFGSAGSQWHDEGWLVPVEFAELEHQIRPKDYIELLRPHLPNRYSPLRSTGDGLQSIYLVEIPEDLVHALIGLIGDSLTRALHRLSDLT